MLKSATLSENAKNIVNNFFSKNFIKLAAKDIYRAFIVSLYATTSQADKSILSILSEYNFELLDYLTPVQLTILQQEYPLVIEFVYNSIGTDSYYFARKSEQGNSMWMPNDLIALCLKIAELNGGEQVFLPYSGEGQFAYNLPSCEIDGFEIDPVSRAFSKILLESKNINSSIQQEAFYSEKKYDCIFTMPPFLKGEEQRAVITTLLNLANNSIKERGAMFAILPMAFCFESHGWFDLRKILFDKFPKFSAAVISLPQMLRPVSAVNICLFVLMKDNKNMVYLMDATGPEFSATHDLAGYTSCELKVQSIIETIKKGDERYVWSGYPTQLTDSLNLTPSRYLSVTTRLPRLKKGERYVSLRELIEIVPRERFGEKQQAYIYLDLKTLSSSYLNCDINRDRFDEISLPRPAGVRSRKITDNNSLLFAYRNNKTFVARLNGFANNTLVAVHGLIIPFRVKSDLVTADFLLRSLTEDYVVQQFTMLNGSIAQKTQEADLLNIQIVLPSVDEQKRLCIEDTRASMREADRKLLESAEDFRRDMHIKKHAIGQTIFNLNNWWRILQNTRSKNDGILRDSDVVGVSNPIEVSKIFENLSVIMNQLQTQISRFDRGNGLVVTKFALTDFIERYIKTHPNALFSFKYDSTNHRASQDLPVVDFDEDNNNMTIHKDEYVLRQGDPLEYVNFAEDALTIIFDNIISNACAHGFVNLEPARNIVSIEIRAEGTDYIVAISNNGHALSDHITHDDIFLYGRSTKLGKDHFGIGAYEVRQLMREFGGDARFISTPNQAFTVAYELIFHNTNIEYSF